jgi:hypothetical protein
LVVAAAAEPLSGRGYRLQPVVSEQNGVGAMPSQELAARLAAANRGVFVQPVHTTVQLKEDAFGFIKLLLQQGRLDLPAHPGLLKQLAALEFALSESGGPVRIAVPERAGHDDLAMALALAVVPLMADDASWTGGALVERSWPNPLALLPGEIDFWTLEW